VQPEQQHGGMHALTGISKSAMTNTLFHSIDESSARDLASRIAEALSTKPKRFAKAASSLSALYRICTRKMGMSLQIYVGDSIQTIWVQNFELHEPFLNLAFVVNEPERAAALVNQADVGLSLPVFLNAEIYCGPELVRRFCEDNSSDIEDLRLKPGERFSVQRKQLRLRLMTSEVDRVLLSLNPMGRVFHRYVQSDAI